MTGVPGLAGTVLEGYRLGECLGWTSHTAVYLASAGAGELLVIKVLDAELEPDGAFAERLRRERGVLRDLGQTAIVTSREVGRAAGLTFVVAPFVPAQPLQQLLDAGRLGNEQAWRILSRVAELLDAAHERGLVHRALKPINVLVDEHDNAYLAEFGMASRRVGPLAMMDPSYVLTTPQYLAPEQIEGAEPDRRADVYALAVMAFEILTAAPLSGAAPVVETLRATLAGQLPPAARARQAALPPGVDAVLARGMARHPGSRPACASELLEELVTVPDERPAAAPPARAPAAPVAPAAAPPAPAEPLPGKAPVVGESMVARLQGMGVPVYHTASRRLLTYYFAALVWHARVTAGLRWPEVLAASGLPDPGEEAPPDDGAIDAPLEDASRLAAAFDDVYGGDAPDVLRLWGRQTTEFWLRRSRRRGEERGPRRRWLRRRPEERVEEVLALHARSLDRVRGESLTAWRRVGHEAFWLVHYDNVMAVGRRRPARSCDFWTGAVEAALRSRGLANEWLVEEAECGCVTGSFNCVFTIQRSPV